jgi:hypothetical protein
MPIFLSNLPSPSSGQKTHGEGESRFFRNFGNSPPDYMTSHQNTAVFIDTALTAPDKTNTYSEKSSSTLKLTRMAIRLKTRALDEHFDFSWIR